MRLLHPHVETPNSGGGCSPREFTWRHVDDEVLQLSPVGPEQKLIYYLDTRKQQISSTGAEVPPDFCQTAYTKRAEGDGWWEQWGDPCTKKIAPVILAAQ